jgi:hypothetical protein
MLAASNSDDLKVHTHATDIHPIRRQLMVCSGCLLFHLRGCTHTSARVRIHISSLPLRRWQDIIRNIFRVSEILLVVFIGILGPDGSEARPSSITEM